ncbi:MAG TPA: recombination mediator RecR [Gemmatimonadaceae bacterium]|nr:recombination mediator RecR [Gemmatimonadaceae bacterium]
MSAIDELAAELARLPGIGRKTALRLTYHLLQQPPEQSQRLAAALQTLTQRVRRCSICFNLTEDDPCAICRDPRRDRALLCVVEEAADIGAIERTGEYRGVYHVLGGRISPLDGVGPEDLTVAELVMRATASGAVGGSTNGHAESSIAAASGEGAIEEGRVREVIIATNPSLEGEATALYVQRRLTPPPGETGPLVSRIARGLPVGGDLEYADGVTIAQALSARRAM